MADFTFNFIIVTQESQKDCNSSSATEAAFHMITQHAYCTLHTAPQQQCGVNDII